MFDGPDYPQSIDEALFDQWIEKGRSSKLGHFYLLIIWNEMESAYQPVYSKDRHLINQYEIYGQSTTPESLIAVYDLYSEARIQISF